ncbi:MAG: XRE family transcriptional regulator [Gammaproteobacteria bacterium]
MTKTSGNIFEDVGFDKEEAANLLIRGQLVIQLSTLIRKRGLKQAEAAKLLSIKQPDASAIMKLKIEKFTIDRLVNFLSRFNQEMTVKTKPVRSKKSKSRIILQSFPSLFSSRQR